MITNLLRFFTKKNHNTRPDIASHRIGNGCKKVDEAKDHTCNSLEPPLIEVLNYIKNNSRNIGIYLNKPATDIDIEAFENIKFKLPEDFKLLYKFSNGFETDHDLFRLIPLEEIIKNGLDRTYLISDTSFHFAEYMIYSDMWSVDVSNVNVNDYRIYNKTDDVVYLTNFLADFLCVFIRNGIYDGLYEWREKVAGATLIDFIRPITNI